jgi:hypothetical protein
MANGPIIVWRRMDQVGVGYCGLASSSSGYHLGGSVVGIEGAQRYRIEYAVRCDSQWHAQEAEVKAAVEGGTRELWLRATADGRTRASCLTFSMTDRTSY